MAIPDNCLDQSPIAEHLEAIRALCREFGVNRLEVFGSVCTEEFDPARSDIDFLIGYPPNYDFGLWLSRYFDFKKGLEELLGRPVDLVMIGAPQTPISSVQCMRRGTFSMQPRTAISAAAESL